MKTVIVTFSSRSGGNCSQIGNLIASMTKNGSFNEVDEEDQILLLITCVGDDDERLVVAAKRV